MNLEDLGFDQLLVQTWLNNQAGDLESGRVITEHKERYLVRTEKGEYEAEITGHMRYTAGSRSDYPAVGDWVVVKVYENNLAIIHGIMPRRSILERQAVGKAGETQILATNVDYGMIVMAADRDFNLNRMERYLTLCYSGKVEPVIVLSKTDLVDEETLELIIREIKGRAKKLPVLAISNISKDGYGQVLSFLEKGKTYCFLGSSGVGKSTLINNLAGEELFETRAISRSTGKGRHTTQYRELILLPNGSIFIDNPGLREVGIADTSEGLETTFEWIIKTGQRCRFADCTHTNELGCAVLEALKDGSIDADAYENFKKMQREKARFTITAYDKKKKAKQFGRMYKEVVKNRRQNKF